MEQQVPAPEQPLRLALGRGDALFAALTLDQDHVLPWDFTQGERTTQTRSSCSVSWWLAEGW